MRGTSRLSVVLVLLVLVMAGIAGAEDELSQGEEAVAAELADLLVNGLISESDAQWHFGDYRKAARAMLSGSALDPSYEEGYDASAWLIWSLGYDAKAVAVYESGIKANPRSTKLLASLAGHHSRVGRPKAALAVLWRSLGIERVARTLMDIGHCYKELGQRSLALRAYTDAARVDPDFGVAHFNKELMRDRLSLMELAFTEPVRYLSAIRYYQLKHEADTGETITKADARLRIAREQREKTPVYVTKQQRDNAVRGAAPDMERSEGESFMGPGPMGPQVEG